MNPLPDIWSIGFALVAAGAASVVVPFTLKLAVPVVPMVVLPVTPKEFDLHINLNLGKAGAVIYAADLTEEYVDFNKGDVGDPSALGG